MGTLQSGILYGVSVGPGDPELIAIKGVRILQQADVVAYPSGRDGEPGLAERIVAPWLQPKQIRLPLYFSFARVPDIQQQAWTAASDCVWEHLKSGRSVAFACEGDAGFYGTFAYLSQTLRLRYPEARIEVVPGVISPIAAAAALGIPLVARDRKLAVLPALYAVGELEQALDWADAVVLLKVSSSYVQVWDILQSRDLLASSWVVVRATQPGQEILADLRDRRDLKLPYFSLLVVQTRSPIGLHTSQ
ncbi:precorrin-2 C(20)-methyltransferase [Rubidibacter lacunae]|uniref:precorrin-2 C(20)-methyltransferase n=1 Tax=Rubidibacter lacunae TaxID=582514 RepID=UPI001E31E269|nr:precorrin-2 C(20)-methyltransferase [Rubidibacter lacunae]